MPQARRLRDLITHIVFCLLAVISAAAAIQVCRTGVTADTRSNRWVVVKLCSPTFAAQPREAKLSLARDLEREFNRGVDIRDQVAQLEGEDWRRFEANFGELMEIWFLDKVDRYEAMREERLKRRYLESQIGRIKSWPVFERGASETEAQDKDRLERLISYLDARFRSMPRRQQERIRRFAFAVWLQNSQLSHFLPGVF
jgi:hypothetical protein